MLGMESMKKNLKQPEKNVERGLQEFVTFGQVIIDLSASIDDVSCCLETGQD